MDDKLARAKAILQDRQASVSASEIISDTVVHVDDGVTNYYVPENVVTVLDVAFENCTTIEKIFITQSVQYLSAKALYALPNLQAVFVSEKNPYFTGYDGCLYSKDISTLVYFRPSAKPEIPQRIKIIGDYAFARCKAYTIDIPDNVIEIGAYAFTQSSIATIRLGSQITKIAPHCFDGCVDLEEVWCSSLTEIGDYAFCDCQNLKTLPIKQTTKIIGEYAFKNDILLTELNLLDGVTPSPYAFAEMNGLTKVTLPKDFTLIPEGLFCGCYRLNSINLLNVITIEDKAFYDCFDLNNIVFNPELKTIGSLAFANNKINREIIIPPTIERIGNNCFQCCTAITRLTTPFMSELVTDEEQKLTHVFGEIPNSLNTLILTDGITHLPQKALLGAEYLIEIKLPQSIISIELQALYGSSCLQRITLPFIGRTKEQAMPLTYFFGTIPKSLYHVYILDGAIEICSNCFKDQQNVEVISIPQTVTKIGSGAFENCRSLQKLIFPNKMQIKIPKNAIKGCVVLKKDFPAGVKVSLF